MAECVESTMEKSNSVFTKRFISSSDFSCCELGRPTSFPFASTPNAVRTEWMDGSSTSP